MKLQLDVENFHDMEYYIILNIIGVLSALYEGAISIDDAEKIVFSPGLLENAEKCGFNADVVELIWQGTELEDVESLFPEELSETILKMKNKAITLCSQIVKPEHSLEKITVTVSSTGTTYTLRKGYPKEIKFEENED